MTIVRRHLVMGLTGAVLAVLALVIASGQGWMFDRDFFTYWAGGRGLLDGVNFYSPAVWPEFTRSYGTHWFPDPVFNYTPVTAILFTPLAALAVPVAATVWLWLSESFIVIAVFIIARELHWGRFAHFAPLSALAITLFMPVLLVLVMGQVSALVLVLIALAAVLWNHRHWFAGGLVLGLVIVKPQPLLLLVPGIVLWLVLNRRWRALAGLALSAGAHVIGAWILFPNFVAEWGTPAAAKVQGIATHMPTVWGFASDLFRGSPFTFAIGAALALLAASLGVGLTIRFRHADPVTVTALLLIPSVVIPPYMWTYDQIQLLIPILVAWIGLDQRGAGLWQVALLPFFFDIAALALFVVAALRLRDSFGVFLPVFVGVVLWMVLGQRERPEEALQTARLSMHIPLGSGAADVRELGRKEDA